MEATLQGPLGQTILEPGVVTIGSTPDSQLIVHDAKVSPHHAVLRPTEQGYTITDWRSTDGTFVNEQRLEPLFPHLLTAGDRIRIGETVFTYEVHEGAALVPENTAYGAGTQPSYTPPAQQQYGSASQQEYAPPPPQQSYTPAPPSYQSYTPSAPQQPYVPPGAPGAIPAYGAPPLQPPYTPPVQQKKPRGWLKIALIVVAALVVLGGVGIGAFLLLWPQPQPVISITSDYKVGSIPAGTTGTVFHVSGKQFSNNSTITFLLDGTPVSGGRLVQSDANGNGKTDLTVTSDWAVGHHTLTARDAENHVTKAGSVVVIVPQGQAHTPGPNGAPPDDKSFAIKATTEAQDSVTGEKINPWNDTLTITGRPDPAGGSVSISNLDNGQPHTYTGNLSDGTTYKDTFFFTGSGTYKGGKLSYIETVTSEKMVFSNGLTCKSNSPYVYKHLEGTFSNQNAISGTYSADAYSYSCSVGSNVTNIKMNAQKGTWTGTLVLSGSTSLITSPVHVQAGLGAIWTKPLAWA
jgi:FHA domain